MARKIHRLSLATIRHAKAGMYGGGLWLQVGGRVRKTGLGSLDTIGLSEAGDKATDYRRLRLQGVDRSNNGRLIADAQVAAVKSMTLDRTTDHYIAAHRAGWRNTKPATQWSNTLKRYASLATGALPGRPSTFCWS